MTRLVLDSSALAKKYLREAGSERVAQLCSVTDEIILSVICLPEVLSGMNRLKRDRLLSPAQYRQLKQSFLRDIEQATVQDLTPSVFAETVRCLETHPVRAMDAIHVGTALATGCSVFASADVRQCDAAEAMGLVVERIGNE